jgi:hypothetical protein
MPITRGESNASLNNAENTYTWAYSQPILTEVYLFRVREQQKKADRDGIRYGLQIKPESNDCEKKVVEEEVGA